MWESSSGSKSEPCLGWSIIPNNDSKLPDTCYWYEKGVTAWAWLESLSLQGYLADYKVWPDRSTVSWLKIAPCWGWCTTIYSNPKFITAVRQLLEMRRVLQPFHVNHNISPESGLAHHVYKGIRQIMMWSTMRWDEMRCDPTWDEMRWASFPDSKVASFWGWSTAIH